MKGRKDIAKHGFKKGQSGNPAGRPKKLPQIDDLLAEVLGGDPDDPGNYSEAKEVLQAMLTAAKKGNVQAQTAILDRAYGKAKQAIEHSGPDGGPIQQKTIIIELPPDPDGEH